MTAGNWAAVVVTLVVAVAVIGLLLVLRSLVSAMTTLRVSVEDLRRQTIPLVSDMQVTVRQANAELARVDTLLDTAESISNTVDSASRLAYLMFSNPVVKALAFASGTSRAWRRLRRPD